MAGLYRDYCILKVYSEKRKKIVPLHLKVMSWRFHVSKPCWMLDVSRIAPMKLLSPSVFPSDTKFYQNWIISFCDIVHDDSWLWYLVTEEARFLKKKKKLVARIWTKWAKSGPKLVFLPFSQIWFISLPGNCI